MASGSYQYSSTLKQVRYGPGCVSTALPDILASFNSSKAFIITGNSLRTKTNVITTIEDLLKSRNLYAGTFSDIGEHSPISGICAALEQVNQTGADILVAIGGGSPIDASKAIIFYHQQQSGGQFMKQIAVPTTLSAAEYTAAAGFTNEKGHKSGVQGNQLGPAAVILDAELTLPTPERLWLSTGIRALDHAVENLYRPQFPEPLRALCYKAIKDLFRYLPQSRENPNDVAIRQKLQIAAWMSMWPYHQEKFMPFGLSHALGHRLGATYGIPHGITSCLTLGPVIKLKARTESEDNRLAIAEILSYIGTPSSGNLDTDVLRVGEVVEGLVTLLGLHTTLKECGVPEKDIETIASAAKHLKQDEQHYEQVCDMLAKL